MKPVYKQGIGSDYSNNTPRYMNDWGMKPDALDLTEKNNNLKKKLKNISDDNMKLKTQNLRLEKLLQKNDRKLKRLLATVAANSKENNINDSMQNSHKKFASTELLSLLKQEQTEGIALKKKLKQVSDELEQTKQEIKSVKNVADFEQVLKMQVSIYFKSALIVFFDVKCIKKTWTNVVCVCTLQSQLRVYYDKLESCYKILENDDVKQLQIECDNKEEIIKQMKCEMDILKSQVAIGADSSFEMKKIIKTQEIQIEELHQQIEMNENKNKNIILLLNDKMKDIETQISETLDSKHLQSIDWQTLQNHCDMSKQWILNLEKGHLKTPDAIHKIIKCNALIFFLKHMFFHMVVFL